MHLQTFEDNLREIYYAAEQKGLPEPCLVADPGGNKIFCASVGWGRLWRWIYRVCEVLFRSRFAESLLKQAIQKTHQCFLTHYKRLQESIAIYCGYLQKMSLGFQEEEILIHPARRAISRWNQAASGFIEAYLDGYSPLICGIGRQIIPTGISPDTSPSLLALRSLQHLIDLEGFLEAPLPLALFKKLACGEPFNKRESQALEAWIIAHNQTDSPLKVGPFHEALRALTDQLARTFPGLKPDLIRLELGLAERGLELFTKEDPSHIQWRAALKPGIRFYENGQEWILGEEIKGKVDENRTLVFRLENDPGKVAVIGINQAILGIKHRIAEMDLCGLPMAACFHLSPSGYYAIYERLAESIDALDWKSANDLIHPDDDDLLIPIAHMIRWMVKENLTPHQLDPKSIRFNCFGTLKYAKPAIAQPFDYGAIENFAFRCANGNLEVYTRLMILSTLAQHPVRNYFRSLFGAGVRGLSADPSTLGAIEEISNPKILQMGKELYTAAARLKTNCLNFIVLNHSVENIQQLVQKVDTQLLNAYERLKLGGTLWPDLEEWILTQAVKAVR